MLNSKKILVTTNDSEIQVNCEKLIIASGSESLMLNIDGGVIG